MHGNSTSLFTTLNFWTNLLKCDRSRLGEDESSEGPKALTTEENIAQVNQMVLDHRRTKIRDIGKAMNTKAS